MIERVVAGINKLSSITKWFGVFFLVAITVIMSYATFTRYVLTKPAMWSDEIARLAQVCLTFIVMGWVLQQEGHISVEILLARLHGKTRDRWIMGVSAFAAAGCAFVVYLSFLTFQASLRIGERGEDTGILIWPFKLLMCLSFALFALQFIARSYQHYQLSRAPAEGDSR